jgi:hypothetical protein
MWYVPGVLGAFGYYRIASNRVGPPESVNKEMMLHASALVNSVDWYLLDAFFVLGGRYIGAGVGLQGNIGAVGNSGLHSSTFRLNVTHLS